MLKILSNYHKTFTSQVYSIPDQLLLRSCTVINRHVGPRQPRLLTLLMRKPSQRDEQSPLTSCSLKRNARKGGIQLSTLPSTAFCTAPVFFLADVIRVQSSQGPLSQCVRIVSSVLSASYYFSQVPLNFNKGHSRNSPPQDKTHL